MNGDLPRVRGVAVFVQVNALPGSEYRSAAGDGNRKAGLGESRANMGRHVVWSLHAVPIQFRLPGNQSPEEIFQIVTDVGVGILLNGQGSRSMLDIERQETGCDLLAPAPVEHLAGEVIEPGAAGANFEGRLCLLQNCPSNDVGVSMVTAQPGETELELMLLQEKIVQCRLCPRLVEYRERVATEKRRAYRDWEYWGRPVPSFGDPDARLLIVGLAPGAHGANRTGRMFSGDRSGEFLFSALHRCGFANQPGSLHRRDGLRLTDAFITAAVRCVPPLNRPNPAEKQTCLGYLCREMVLLQRIRVVLALGAVAWQSCLAAFRQLGWALPRPLARFGHGFVCELDSGITLAGSYHPSQQNTQTGRLTPEMLDEVLARVVALLG